VVEEYIADENLFFDAQEHNKEMSVLEGARPDDETVLTSNLTSSSVNKNEDRHVERQGPLTFDPSPPLDDNDQVDLIAADEQSELMRLHHCLGHLSFAKIKALALAGKIPKKLAKVKPPVCAGCLYSAMTKVNWKGKEDAHGHQVFVATKPGQCVSVDQMISTTSWICGAIERNAHQEKVQGCNCVCWPFFAPPVRSLDDDPVVRQNGCSQTCIQTICRTAWHHDSTLPLRQWQIY
jgi:hypothetical protein